MSTEGHDTMNENVGPETKHRWKTYGKFKLILMIWMMNDLSISFSPSEISHNGFYVYMMIHLLAVVFVGIPLVYSEMTLAQYTNCDIFTMWKFCPLLQNTGYGTLYMILLKTIYMLVLSAWYLIYTFYSASDRPPWIACEEFPGEKCMVKRVNFSTFQHCIETQELFNYDCGVKTASNCFFTREIGSVSTLHTPYCFYSCKVLLAVIVICISIFILSIKKEIFLQHFVKFIAYYIGTVMLILGCVAMSTNGNWYANQNTFKWDDYEFNTIFIIVSRGYFSLGTGYGIIVSLSSAVPFRSPATMTAISISLYSMFVTFMLSLITFSGIKNMSYYHGEADNVLEVGTSIFFQPFASSSEILSYFDPVPIWAFLWFSIIFIALYVNIWILYLFQQDFLLSNCLAKKFPRLSSALLLIFIIILSLPFLCSDVASSLLEVTEMLQAISTFIFSVSFYWIYGAPNHNVDIIFMIGIKANYYWKITWIINPIILFVSVYVKWSVIICCFPMFDDTYIMKSISMPLKLLVFYILVGLYFLIILIGIFAQLIINCHHRSNNLFSPTPDWGPKDIILARSRNMFVPEIMTRDFLYRQVRIYGYNKNKNSTDNSKDIDEECNKNIYGY